MKPVYAGTWPHEVEMIRLALASCGIPAQIENQGGALYAIGLPALATPLLVTVPARDEARALDVVREALRKLGSREVKDVPVAGRTRCSCGETLDYFEGQEGTTFECPWCRREVLVPGASAPAASGPHAGVFWRGRRVGDLLHSSCQDARVSGVWTGADDPSVQEFLMALWVGDEVRVDVAGFGTGRARMPADSETLTVDLEA